VPDIPSMDEILKQGRQQERRKELVVGAILLFGGLASWVGMSALTGGGVQFVSIGALVLGIGLIGDGLFRKA
jgi:hypothetical protein